ncbi:MAG: ATP synthase F1 subunit delta [Bacteroidota bacterium]
MLNPRLASRYAKSLLTLAREQGNLDEVQADMSYLQNICKQSAEFVAVLRSPVIQADKKIKVIGALVETKISSLSFVFIQLLIKKGREAVLPEIAAAFIDQCYLIKGIHKVKLTTATEMTDSMKNSITEKVKNETSFLQVELETKTNEALIGGFQLEFNGKLIDASIAHDLRAVKQQFQKNTFINNLK